ncbi:helix-turn-helix transcriptional regulator [Streptomyces sp. VRA16 Mangrove soil]|uniref:helix-turn-helix transcriptional regulator n=1 Tax=Streptomyces sp. VRA16 Mangrove soil TaxID=2817434 RepID=UPI001A9DCA87|nr:helix-turn-helix transcriptional regulator [Streptomyces sp. VRA16 Mangrove soil]MBO1335973.1 helix-turn-helix domain-containing protein [Streptomyces sp. VRA16 Mangrove soil]
MDSAVERRSELRQFLRSRRARLQPADVGLVSYGPRRVPGLRREELAQLAGVSVEYYVRLEQGRNPHVSDGVLDAVGRALRLDAAEQDHLRSLARPDRARPTAAAREVPRPGPVRPALQRLLDGQPGPAYVTGPRTDVVAWNAQAAAVFGDFGELPPQQRNFAYLTFLDETYRALFADSWQAKAESTVAFLRVGVGRHPDDADLASLLGLLTMKSPEFAALWARQDVRDKSAGRYLLRHAVVGPLDLDFEILHLPEAGQVLVSYVPVPDTEAGQNLALLASWTG